MPRSEFPRQVPAIPGVEERESVPGFGRLGRPVRGAALAWIVLALGTHLGGFAAAVVFVSIVEFQKALQQMRAGQREFFKIEQLVEIEEQKKADEPPPPPEPEPAAPPPEPKATPPLDPQAPPPPKADPYDPPPAPAEAAKVLTQDGPEDFTGQGFVSGESAVQTYGQVSAAGTGTVATRNPNAVVGGTPGGTGSGPPQAPPPPPGPDRSRPPGLAGGSAWNCNFPPEADVDQIDTAVATVVVTVRPDGSAAAVKVTADPGHGFGRAARSCALTRKYNPGLDRAGNPITATTPPINVRFVR